MRTRGWRRSLWWWEPPCSLPEDSEPWESLCPWWGWGEADCSPQRPWAGQFLCPAPPPPLLLPVSWVSHPCLLLPAPRLPKVTGSAGPLTASVFACKVRK